MELVRLLASLLAAALLPAAVEGRPFEISLTFFLARPTSVLLTVCANRSEHSVSAASQWSADRLTIMSVFPSPDKHGDNKWVKALFLKGTCEACTWGKSG